MTLTQTISTMKPSRCQSGAAALSLRGLIKGMQKQSLRSYPIFDRLCKYSELPNTPVQVMDKCPY